MQTKYLWWKLMTEYLFFLFFHQIYDILGGGTLATILGEGIESIYAHMKMYFYSYLLVSLIDYFLRRRSLFQRIHSGSRGCSLLRRSRGCRLRSGSCPSRWGLIWAVMSWRTRSS